MHQDGISLLEYNCIGFNTKMRVSSNGKLSWEFTGIYCLTDDLQFLIETGLLKWTPWRLVGLGANYTRHDRRPPHLSRPPCARKERTWLSRDLIYDVNITKFVDTAVFSQTRSMPKVRRSKKRPPEGWELIEPTLDELDQKMREGKPVVNVLWLVHVHDLFTSHL